MESRTLLGAAEARVAGADRPRAEPDIAEPDRRTIGACLRTLAADLVQAPALAVALVASAVGGAVTAYDNFTRTLPSPETIGSINVNSRPTRAAARLLRPLSVVVVMPP